MIEQGLATEPTSSHPRRRLLILAHAHHDPAHDGGVAHDDCVAHDDGGAHDDCGAHNDGGGG